ncbi:Alpha/Beta hydrolase protein [Amylocarpus encephaloides]|uniref:Alpha/Beta hydrolase protein n=1 Tax=Amylocarpus encephaloides TaxID=45428 RepID=A0A9P7YMF5_9HELO|nr:Alpha/Beta hydrolase protein [Amylocarpus encephaloides]
MALVRSDRHKLLWKQPATADIPSELSENISRHWVTTPLGKLEVLYAEPSETAPQQEKALLFQHGGFGFGAEWIPYMTWFSQRGYRCYAVSLRGHGGSWKPRFFQMVWRYGKRDMAADLGYCYTWISAFEAAQKNENFNPENLVLVGHSAGGGLGQYFLSQGLGEVGGLVLMGPFPSWGGLGVYANWFKLDPWFAPRYYIRDLWHPRSPLSSTSLVHGAFFSQEFPTAKVQEFELQMPEYESMVWPLGFMLPLAKVHRVVRAIIGWKNNGTRLLVVAGEKDKLMALPIMQKLAVTYREAIRKMLGVAPCVEENANEETPLPLAIVKGSGHHIQNDLYWEDGANQIMSFLEKL